MGKFSFQGGVRACLFSGKLFSEASPKKTCLNLDIVKIAFHYLIQQQSQKKCI